MAKRQGGNPTKALAKLRHDVLGMARDAMEQVCEDGAETARGTNAFRNYTGRLRRSIRGGILHGSPGTVVGVLTAGDDDAVSGRDGWETPSREYSVYVELGTSKRPPHAFLHPVVTDIASQNAVGREFAQRWHAWRA